MRLKEWDIVSIMYSSCPHEENKWEIKKIVHTFPSWFLNWTRILIENIFNWEKVTEPYYNIVKPWLFLHIRRFLYKVYILLEIQKISSKIVKFLQKSKSDLKTYDILIIWTIFIFLIRL